MAIAQFLKSFFYYLHLLASLEKSRCCCLLQVHNHIQGLHNKGDPTIQAKCKEILQKISSQQIG